MRHCQATYKNNIMLGTILYERTKFIKQGYVNVSVFKQEK